MEIYASYLYFHAFVLTICNRHQQHKEQFIDKKLTTQRKRGHSDASSLLFRRREGGRKQARPRRTDRWS